MESSLGAKTGRKRRNGGSRKRKAPFRVHSPPPHEEVVPGKDYTPEILEFLTSAHGKVRIDNQGDYYYENVSTISLHFLLQSRLPAKEVLWRWYAHFERGRAESIYQTLPPQRDEEFLEILSTCAFEWDEEAVRESGLVFLSEHRAEVYMGLEEFLAMRLDAFETMDDAQLAEVLNPAGTWSDLHLRKLVRQVQTQPLAPEQRQSIYDELESDYLRATARHLLDEATSEAFWKAPPPELEALRSRFIIFARTMTNTARRLGVFSSRRAFEEQAFRASGAGRGRFRSGNGSAGAGNRVRHDRRAEQAHFAALGLQPTATLMEVRNAYRDRVKRHHPDQGGSVQDFLRLQEAYEYLLTQVF